MVKAYDAIVVGGGPAGLSAAIYLARAKFSVLVIEKEKFGGQITITSEVVNYPGIIKTDGKKLTAEMREQASLFGAEFLLANVEELNLKEDVKKVITDKGSFECAGIVLATGSSPRKLGFKGEKEFQGRGVAYCATCDGEFFTGADVFVIGGGFAAAEEAIFLTKYARHVTIIVREPDFTCAKTIADKVRDYEQITVHTNTEIIEASGDGALKKAIFINNVTKETWSYEAAENETFGIFVFAGYEPANALFKDQVELNEFGNVITDMNRKTSLDGVYAAGDICVKNLRQVVTAVSDGAIAATSLERVIEAVVEKYHLQTEKLHVKENKSEDKTESKDDGFISTDMLSQLKALYQKLEKDVWITCYVDESKFGLEMQSFIKEFAETSPHIKVENKVVSGSDYDHPVYVFHDEQKKPLGLEYHAVPGGHEFTSFALAVYNAAGPKQSVDEELLKAINNLTDTKNIKVMVSLSCTMCPEVVQSAQRIALENTHVNVEIYDLAHFPKLKEQYKIMSVPCMVINDENVHFGKKTLKEIIEYL